MKTLRAYSRRKLDRAEDLNAVLEIIDPVFGLDGLTFDIEVNPEPVPAVPFEVRDAVKRLQRRKGVGFFREASFACGIDCQDFRTPSPVYPHSEVNVITLGEDEAEVEDWLRIARGLVERLDAEFAILFGEGEKLADFKATPLCVGIGLPRVFWIMCFGRGYSNLISPKEGVTAFFRREEFGQDRNCLAFVSAPSYEEHLLRTPEVAKAQKKEIGEDLFHRYQPDPPQAGGGEVVWILNPKAIYRFAKFLYRQHMTNWRKYQAKTVPTYYR